uniref:NADH-ubiquinone oxidoreductase chain 6 n=1 Tax=Brillia brevicornis TaxID=2970799 RepID=A0A976YHB9_9DIPT|nr:NADH dehydrogenase subunit 6 [Brillia brevicornis]UVG40813.1 NADH dehydrogenase subunit 6 [Brillia brevicornis]
MFQLLIINLNIISSTIFLQLKHPLAMGFLLLIQTCLICVMAGNFCQTFWFSYILFITFLGGMLILFIYVSSLASNEMFNFSMKMVISSSIMYFFIFCFIFILNQIFISNYFMTNDMEMITSMKSLMMENTLMLNKLYNFPNNMITILLMNYLFLTLVAVVKITNLFEGPLRPKHN